MKKLKLLVWGLLLLLSQEAVAQTTQELIARGNRVYIEVNDLKENTSGALDSFRRHLLSDEWNRWTLVDTPQEADFVCRVNIDKKGFNFFSFKSDGARVRVDAEILTPEGKSVWRSKRQQGNVTVFTGGDALSDAMRKIIRRSLKEELYGEVK